MIRCNYHPIQTALWKGQAFCFALLGGAPYAAVSGDFRSVLHLRFYQRVYGCQGEGLYFDFVYISSELFLFATTTSRGNNIRSRCATTSLPTSPETVLTSHCESDKLSLLSLVRMMLTRNNHCERGFGHETARCCTCALPASQKSTSRTVILLFTWVDLIFCELLFCYFIHRWR